MEPIKQETEHRSGWSSTVRFLRSRPPTRSAQRFLAIFFILMAAFCFGGAALIISVMALLHTDGVSVPFALCYLAVLSIFIGVGAGLTGVTRWVLLARDKWDSIYPPQISPPERECD